MYLRTFRGTLLAIRPDGSISQIDRQPDLATAIRLDEGEDGEIVVDGPLG